MRARHVLAIDAGTTGNRAILFDSDARVVADAYRELPVTFPRPGWVEQDALAIRDGCLAAAREALSGADPRDVAAIGISAPKSPGSQTPISPPVGPTSGSIDGGTSKSAQSSASHAPVRMSKSCVRDAFDASVAWRRPAVRFHRTQLSTVPAIAPAGRRTFSRIQRSFDAEK